MQTSNCNNCNSGFKIGLPTGKPIKINKSVAESCFDLQGQCGADIDIESNDIKMIISSASNNEQLIEYPAFTVKDNTVCFYWDSLLYDLDFGRYVGSIVIDGETVLQVQFEQSHHFSIASVNHTERTHKVKCDED